MRGLNWLTGRGGLNRKTGAQAQPEHAHAVSDEGFRPARAGESLLQTEERRRLIRVLLENSPLSPQVTEAWWLRPLEEMAACVQDCPAAWHGPYSGAGGFTDLSLHVAASAVRRVRGMMLPPGSTPEEQAEQIPGWACAVYWAGLLHNLEWLAQVEGALKGGGRWYPGLSVPGGIWRVRPKAPGAGTQSGMYMAVRLLPEAGLIWLQRWPVLSDSLLMFLSGRRAEAGMLSSIISEARNGCGMPVTAVLSAPSPHASVHAGPENDLITPKLYETDAPPLSSDSSALAPLGPIISDASPYTPTPENEAPPAVAMKFQPPLTLASALSNDEVAAPADNDSPPVDGQTGESSTGSLLSMLDLMAEGKPLTPSDAVAGVMKNGGVETGIGELFLAWLQDSIEDGTLSINEKDSVLHVLAQFVFLVSPACFYRYIATAGDGVADKDRLQKSFESLGVHHSRNGKGLFHYHQYDTPDKSGRFTKVSGYMINADIIFKKGCCPADSIWLSAKK